MDAPRPIKFGTDGWRAVVADDFTYETVRFVAQGISWYVGSDPRPIVVGHDARYSAELFAQEVARVLVANHHKVILCSAVAPTPVITWTVVDRKAVGGIVVTASHNPAEFNGIKYKPDYGGSAPQDVVDEIERHTARAQREGVKAMSFAEAQATGRVEMYDPFPSYAKQVGKLVDIPALKAAGLRVLHDPIYGAGSGYLTRLLAGGKTVVDEIHGERNPGFAGLHPEPIGSYMPKTLELVKSGSYDVGIANDGDADRIGVIEGNGIFLNQLETAALFMMYLIEKRGAHGPVVRSLTSTSMLDALGKHFGVDVIETKVGFKFIGPEMSRRDAIIGCEESGGFAFRGHIPERDGILAALYTLDMIVQYGMSLADIMKHLVSLVGSFAYLRRDIRFPREGYEDRKREVLAMLHDHPPTNVGPHAVVKSRTDDGAKLYLESGSWVLVRMSGTEPLMRIYSEADSPKNASAFVDDIAKWVEKQGVALPA